MFENKNQPLLSLQEFRSRVLRFLLIALGVTLAWLAGGAEGFHYIAERSWRDAMHNAAMMVSTMGPVYDFTTTPSKIFTAFYALGSSLVFIGVVSIASAPVIHRFFHYFHLEQDTDEEEESQ